MYAVVEFLDSHDVAVVPMIWVSASPDGLMTCQWPTTKAPTKLKSLVETRSALETGKFDVYDCRILYSTGKFHYKRYLRYS